jgi:hypothetical protein
VRASPGPVAPSAGPERPMRRRGANCPVVVMKPGNALERRGRSSPLDRVNRQREEPDNQRKAAAFVRSQEPDESRSSRPHLRAVSGRNCPGRLGASAIHRPNGCRSGPMAAAANGSPCEGRLNRTNWPTNAPSRSPCVTCHPPPASGVGSGIACFRSSLITQNWRGKPLPIRPAQRCPTTQDRSRQPGAPRLPGGWNQRINQKLRAPR